MFEQCFGLLFKRLNSGFAVCSNKVFEQCLNVKTNTLGEGRVKRGKEGEIERGGRRDEGQ